MVFLLGISITPTSAKHLLNEEEKAIELFSGSTKSSLAQHSECFQAFHKHVVPIGKTRILIS